MGAPWNRHLGWFVPQELASARDGAPNVTPAFREFPSGGEDQIRHHHGERWRVRQLLQFLIATKLISSCFAS